MPIFLVQYMGFDLDAHYYGFEDHIEILCLVLTDDVGL